MEYKDKDELLETMKAMRSALGFRVRVTAAELKAHLLARAGTHRTRGEELVAKVTTLREKVAKGATNIADVLEGALGVGADTMALGGYGGMGGNFAAQQQVQAIIQSIEANVTRHQVTAKSFDFFAAHLAEEAYDLTMVEASSLELVDEDTNVIGGGLARYVPRYLG